MNRMSIDIYLLSSRTAALLCYLEEIGHADIVCLFPPELYYSLLHEMIEQILCCSREWWSGELVHQPKQYKTTGVGH